MKFHSTEIEMFLVRLSSILLTIEVLNLIVSGVDSLKKTQAILDLIVEPNPNLQIFFKSRTFLSSWSNLYLENVFVISGPRITLTRH